MKFLVTLFWALAIGQVVAFIGAKLLNVDDNALYAALTSIGFAIFIYLLEVLVIRPEERTPAE